MAPITILAKEVGNVASRAPDNTHGRDATANLDSVDHGDKAASHNENLAATEAWPAPAEGPLPSPCGSRDRGTADRAAHRQFLLTWVQPGLAGLMDGSLSTLAPVFAVAFATRDPWTTFLVGLSASVGAGISMGFTEAVHDDGKLSGRGAPWKRGLASGVMTTIGGLGHTLPYLIPSFWTATLLAMMVVIVELGAIAWIQNHFMQTPFVRAIFRVVLGGGLVVTAGILIGGA
jgi:erythrin-vacuolar iron transport family protein